MTFISLFTERDRVEEEVVRRTCREVAKWIGGDCLHSKQRFRTECRQCFHVMWLALEKGEVPK